MFDLTYVEMIVRLLIALIVGGVIGYERESKGHHAGLRTHILVSVGSAIFTLVQIEALFWSIELANANPDLLQVLSSDVTRLTAQIVSGIGFLGAGTIIVTKKKVSGLTTAASIWAVASLGIAAGMGNYFISLAGCFVIFSVLRLLKKVFRVENTKMLEITFIRRQESKEFLRDFFDERNIHVLDLEFSIQSNSDSKEQESIYTSLYTLNIPDNLDFINVVEKLSVYDNILRVGTLHDDS